MSRLLLVSNRLPVTARVEHNQLTETPPTLRQAVHWIARLGGFLERRGDGEPGVTVLWKGFEHLADLTTMYRILHSAPPKRKKCG